MITVIILAIAGATWYLIYELNDWGFDGFYTCFMTFVSFLGGALTGLLLAFILPADLSTKTFELKIESLQDDSGIEGRFFIGSGHINNEMHYVFYYESDGLYRMAQVQSKRVSIKYSEGQPKAVVTEITKTDSWINWFACDADVGEQTYILEVPKGTIHNSYNLDAR